MLLSQYQCLAKQTLKYDENVIDRLALGLCAEVGELAQLIRDSSKDVEELKSEIGDVLWYLSVLTDRLGLYLPHIAEDNLAKLRRRDAGQAPRPLIREA